MNYFQLVCSFAISVNTLLHLHICIWLMIYAFSLYSVWVCAFPKNGTHDLGVASTLTVKIHVNDRFLVASCLVRTQYFTEIRDRNDLKFWVSSTNKWDPVVWQSALLAGLKSSMKYASYIQSIHLNSWTLGFHYCFKQPLPA